MARFVPDVKTQRWIIISPVRHDRPDQFVKEAPPQAKICVFCEGNESLTPPEVMRVGEGEKDKPGWKIRVVPNKFPITDTHEVIIHSPDHTKSIEDFEIGHVEAIVRIFKERYLAHANDGQVMIFCNFGEHAGASLGHPHSQLVVIPKQINLDALSKEPIANNVMETAYFVSYCPDFSQWPYEVWIAPKKDGVIFGDINDEEIKDLAMVLQQTLKRLHVVYNTPTVKAVRKDWPFAYNYYIHHGKDWFVRIIPRLVHRAGFELGTGLNVNVVDPVQAATDLKRVQV
ncbi:DUF4931 domain-containing protein [Candidatus Gottesmanbacteria bacterium]|nr:DUF4931 domain-containing protein [Candidatus Gottesmanbacteria bacterium]